MFSLETDDVCPKVENIEQLFELFVDRHTKEMIKKLESAGLGYHVSADETEDKLGMLARNNLLVVTIHTQFDRLWLIVNRRDGLETH